jgi:hypothetical protein
MKLVPRRVETTEDSITISSSDAIVLNIKINLKDT